jgi:hypothetical protein
MGFFSRKPKWQHPKSHIRIKAIAKLEDDSILKQMAMQDENIWVREAAVRKMADPALIFEVARNSPDESTRKAAVKKLSDREALSAIAANDKHWEIRAAAHEKLGNPQAAAAEAVRNSDNYLVREKAVRVLTDQTLLAHVALNDEKYTVRHEAVRQVNDRAVLEQVIGREKSTEVLSTARLRLKEFPAPDQKSVATRKMNVKVAEMLSGMPLKCPKCGTGFNPGAIGLIMAFESLDKGATVSGPDYTCPHCAKPASIREWYDSTLSFRT